MDRSVIDRLERRILAALIVTVWSLAGTSSASAQSAETFYAAQLQRGSLEYQAGNYTEAARHLNIAVFGLMENLVLFERAQILLALSEQGRGNFLEATEAIQQVLQVETIERHYPPPGLEPEVLRDFELAVRRLVPGAEFPPPQAPNPEPRNQPVEAEPVEEELEDLDTTTPDEVQPEPPPEVPIPEEPELAEAEASVPEPSPVIDPEETRSLEETVERIAILTRQLRAAPTDIDVRLDLARSYLAVGQASEARQLAESVLRVQPENRDAQLTLARASARERRWEQAIQSFEAADAVSPLSSDDLGTFIVCLVAAGQESKAREIEPRVTGQTRVRPDVRLALEQIGARGAN